MINFCTKQKVRFCRCGNLARLSGKLVRWCNRCREWSAMPEDSLAERIDRASDGLLDAMVRAKDDGSGDIDIPFLRHELKRLLAEPHG